MTVTRADGKLAASWPAVASATAYHVTYTSDNKQSWKLAAGRHTSASITISGVDNAKTYIVGVRAGNDNNQWSLWRNSAPAGPYTPPNTPPARPSSVSVTRADGTLTASGYAVSNATKYHVTYTTDNGKSWTAAPCGQNCGNNVTLSGADNAKTYIVGVRAGNAHGWSLWRNSPASGPYVPKPAAPSNIKAYGGNESVTLAWDDPKDDSIHYYEYQYREDSAANFGDWTATPKGSGDITSYTITGLTNDTKYHFKLRAVGSGGESAPTASVSATPEDGVTLPPQPGPQPPETPGAVTLTRAVGTLTADWPDVQRATSYHVTYSSDNGASWSLAALSHAASNITITGVTDTASYIVGVRGHNESGYGPWRNSAPIGSLFLTVSNLDETAGSYASHVGQSGSNNLSKATGFRTGSNTGGYTLQSVTVRISNVLGEPTSYTVAIHGVSTSNPDSTALHTLNGSAPTGAGNYTYTCSGSCSLDAGKDYFLVLSATGTTGGELHVYDHSSTTSDDQTNTPSGAGWLIADVQKSKSNNGAWNAPTGGETLMFKVTAIAN